MFEFITSLSILMCFMIPFYMEDQRVYSKKSKKELKDRLSRQKENLDIIEQNDLNIVKQIIEDEEYFKVYLMLSQASLESTVFTYDFREHGLVFHWDDLETEKEYEFNTLSGLKSKTRGMSDGREMYSVTRFYCSSREKEFWEDVHLFYRLKKEEKVKRIREQRGEWGKVL